MKTTSFLNAAIFAVVLSAACSSDDDTTGPEIKLLQPVNEAAFMRGDRVTIEFDLADPSGINAYKIDIHYAAGDHAHTHALRAAAAEEDSEEPWSYQASYDDRKGQPSAHVTLTAVVPNNAQEGEYHLGILATDVLGNESQVYINIDIEEE
jgi:hypothetical protein